MRIKELLQNAINILKENNIKEPILKSRMILAKKLEKSKEYLILHDDEEVEPKIEEQYKKGIKRLVDGEPLQYITGEQEFMGLDFFVNKNVLIPRPDTEILVEEVINISKKDSVKILDMCTGSGAIAVSCAKFITNSKVIAADISVDALDVTQKNILKNNVNVETIQTNLFEKIQDTDFDIIVSNPPYIETEVIRTLDLEVRNEPIIALDGGQDGLDFYRKIIDEAYKFLKPNGYLCLEIGYNQKEKVIKLLQKNNNYSQVYSKKDLAGNDRIVVCIKK